MLGSLIPCVDVGGFFMTQCYYRIVSHASYKKCLTIVSHLIYSSSIAKHNATTAPRSIGKTGAAMTANHHRLSRL